MISKLMLTPFKKTCYQKCLINIKGHFYIVTCIIINNKSQYVIVK